MLLCCLCLCYLRVRRRCRRAGAFFFSSCAGCAEAVATVPAARAASAASTFLRCARQPHRSVHRRGKAYVRPRGLVLLIARIRIVAAPAAAPARCGALCARARQPSPFARPAPARPFPGGRVALPPPWPCAPSAWPPFPLRLPQPPLPRMHFPKPACGGCGYWSCGAARFHAVREPVQFPVCGISPATGMDLPISFSMSLR